MTAVLHSENVEGLQHGVALINSIEYDFCSVTVDNQLRLLNKYVLLKDFCCYCFC